MPSKNKGQQTADKIKAQIEIFMGHQYSISGEDNALKVLNALNTYSKLTENLDKQYHGHTPQVISHAINSGGNSKQVRSQIRNVAKKIISNAEAQRVKMHEQLMQNSQQAQQLQTEQASLIAEFKDKAKAYLELNVESSNYANRAVFYEEYKDVQTLLLDNINNLKIVINQSDIPAQNLLIGEINELSSKVNQHSQQMSITAERIHQRIEQATFKAAANTSKLTVGQLIAQLANSHGLALPQVNDDVNLITAQARLAIEEQANSSALVKLEQSTDLIDVNGKKLTLDDMDDMPVALLSAKTQVALVGAMMQELSVTAETVEQKQLIEQLAQQLQNNVDGLLSGDLTHITLVSSVDGHINSRSISIQDMLINPIVGISAMGKALFDTGVRDQEIVMSLTNPVQNQALLDLNGVLEQSAVNAIEGASTLQLLANTVVENAGSSQALVQVFSKLDIAQSENMVALLQQSKFINKPLNIQQIIPTMLSMLMIVEATKLAQDPNADLSLTNEDVQLLEGALDMMSIANLESTKAEGIGLTKSLPMIEGTSPIMVPVDAPNVLIELIDEVKAEAMPKHVNELIDNVQNILIDLEQKINKEPREKYKDTATELYKNLNTNLHDFKDRDSYSTKDIKLFQQELELTIKDVMPKFKQAPSWVQWLQNGLMEIANFFRPLTSAVGLASAQDYTMFRPESHKTVNDAYDKIRNLAVDKQDIMEDEIVDENDSPNVTKGL